MVLRAAFVFSLFGVFVYLSVCQGFMQLHPADPVNEDTVVQALHGHVEAMYFDRPLLLSG